MNDANGSSEGSNGATADTDPLPAVVTQAAARLDAALLALETVVDGHLEHHVDNAAAAAEVQRLNADRARLARSLDEAEARSGRLDEANREVSRRLVGAMETIRAVLERTQTK